MSALVFRPFLAVGSRPQPPVRDRAAAPFRSPKRRDGAVRAEPPLDADEAQSFRRTFLPLMDAAYAYARALTRDATAAEDLTQDAYLRAFRAFRGYRGGEPKAWIFAIVRSCFLSQLRQGRRRPEAEGDDELEGLVDPTDSPEAALLRDADGASVRAAVDALPDPFREAIVLRELQELSYREIAELTAVPIGTVMSRLARARQLLAASLAVEGRP